MNRKIIIVSIIFSIIIIGIGLFLVFNKQSKDSNDPLNNSPFGEAPGGSSSQGDFSQVNIGHNPEKIKNFNGLKKISDSPVSGGNFLPLSTDTSPTIEFIERSTGHIFHASIEDGNITRISNNTFPKIQKIIWGIPGKSLIVQSVESGAIQSKILEIKENTATSSTNKLSTITSKDLTQNIIDGSFSPKKDSIFYLRTSFSGAEGYLTGINGGNSVLLWQHAISEWETKWLTNNTIALTNKASNDVDGILLYLDTKTKKAKTVIHATKGLTTNISPSGNKIFYGMSDDAVYKTFIYDVQTKLTTEGFFTTLPEKCAWSNDEKFIVCSVPKEMGGGIPDLWYKGVISFRDELWMLNIENSETKRISDLNPTPEEFIDAIDLQISQDDSHITFMNKKDLSLWATPINKQ